VSNQLSVEKGQTVFLMPARFLGGTERYHLHLGGEMLLCFISSEQVHVLRRV